MSLSDRLREAREQREARAAGFEAAVGIPAHDDAAAAEEATGAGRTCPACDTDGRVDLVDLGSARAYLSCTSCGRSWETSNLASVLRR